MRNSSVGYFTSRNKHHPSLRSQVARISHSLEINLKLNPLVGSRFLPPLFRPVGAFYCGIVTAAVAIQGIELDATRLVKMQKITKFFKM